MVRLWAANTKGNGKLADLWQGVETLMPTRLGCDGPLLSLAFTLWGGSVRVRRGQHARAVESTEPSSSR